MDANSKLLLLLKLFNLLYTYVSVFSQGQVCPAGPVGFGNVSTGGSNLDAGYQYVFPQLNFSCDGVITQWVIGMEGGQSRRTLHLQVWYQNKTNSDLYHLRDEVIFYKPSNAELATIDSCVTASAEDMVGVYLYSGRLKLKQTGVNGYTLLAGTQSDRVAPSPTLSVSSTGDGTSPYISVAFKTSSPCTVARDMSCLTAFRDFGLDVGEDLSFGTQYIIPQLVFSCDGVITQWKFGMEDGKTGRTVYLQIWYQNETDSNSYILRDQVIYLKTENNRIGFINSSVSVSSGDVVGVSVNGDLDLRYTSRGGYTLLKAALVGVDPSSVTVEQSTTDASVSISVLFMPIVPSMSDSSQISSSISPVSSSTILVNTESVPTNPTLSGGAVAGVVVAVILVLIIVIFIVISTILLVGRTKIKDYAKIYFTTNGKGTGNVRINTRSNTDAELLKNTTYQHSDQNGMLYSEPAYETPVHHEVSGASIVANYETASAFYQYVPTANMRTGGQKAIEDPNIYQELESIYSNASESAYDDILFYEPPEKLDELYTQLHTARVIEMPRLDLRLTKVLGHGEFGEVHRGVWDSNYGSQEVAIKMLKPGSGESDQTRFLQEAAIMAQFRHPNIVRMFGAVTLSEPVLLVLEFLSSGDLLNHLNSLKPKKTDIILGSNVRRRLLRFCREIAEGMKYLSLKGFIHRDLAARNILLDKDMKCKIADFGMSKNLDEEEYYVTTGGRIPVKWTPPEALFYKKYSPASDVWSYGMLMFEIWSLGEKPFPSKTVQELVKILQNNPTYIQPPPCGCPREVFKTMVLCWNGVHHDRPDFTTILQMLQKEDNEMLEIPSADLKQVDHPQEATRLGASGHFAHKLYLDLQKYYY